GSDTARGLAVLRNRGGGYVLDAWGGLHPFSTGWADVPAAQVSRYAPWDWARGVAIVEVGTPGGEVTAAAVGVTTDGWGDAYAFTMPTATGQHPPMPGVDQPRSVYRNSVIADDEPDPFVLRVGGTLYAYGTNRWGSNLPIYRSTDGGATWQFVVDGISPLPAWAHQGGTWAPTMLHSH